jgi:hypothetical protein
VRGKRSEKKNCCGEHNFASRGAEEAATDRPLEQFDADQEAEQDARPSQNQRGDELAGLRERNHSTSLPLLDKEVIDAGYRADRVRGPERKNLAPLRDRSACNAICSSLDCSVFPRPPTVFRIHAGQTWARKRRMQMPPQDLPNLPEQLQLSHRIPIYWDPVPPWVAHILDNQILKQLAVIQLEVQKVSLEAQLKALDKTVELLKRG